MLLVALFLSCSNQDPKVPSSEADLDPGDNAPESGDGEAQGDLDPRGQEASQPAGWLQTLAAQGAATELGVPEDRSTGVLVLTGGEKLYFFGSSGDVHLALSGSKPNEPLEAVLIGSSTSKPPCLGVLDYLPDGLIGLAGGEGGSGTLLDGTIVLPGGGTIPLQLCPGALPSWSDLFASQAADFGEIGSPIVEDTVVAGGAVPPPSSCSSTTCASTCGASESRVSIAGQTAYSNGAYTTTGCGCTPSASAGTTSTDDYQCTQFVDRVHGHDGGTYNWTGSASSGYWTSTSSGPYQKGLIPFGTGTSYDAPLSGDIIVWSYSYGHVGIIGSVGSTSLTIYDQNRSCGSQSCTMGYSTSSGYTLSNGSGRCFSSTSSYTVLGYARRGWDFGATFGLASGSSSTNWWPNDASYVSGSSTSSGTYTGITDYIAINPGTSDPYLTSPTGLSVAAYSSSATYGYKYLKFYMKSDCSNKTAALYWRRTTDTSFSEDRKVTATVSSSWSTVSFYPYSDSDWSGTIDQVRIDPASSCSSGSTDTIYIAYAYFDR